MQTDVRISEEAADWLIRLEDDDSAECRAAFFDWLKQSAWHVREFLAVTEEWRGLDGMDAAGRIDVRTLMADAGGNVVALDQAPSLALPRGTREGEKSPPLRSGGGLGWGRGTGIAAGVAAVVLSASWFVLQSAANQIYATGVGEQRTVKLNDGSVLYLNARTRIEVGYSKKIRQLKLLDGEALFVVGRDPSRPFRVTAGAAIIQALGTQFNVYTREDGATVSVLEGAVQISGPRPVKLAAGEEATVGKEGRTHKQTVPDIPRAVAWRQRQLVFRDDPLARVAAEFNRYNRVQIQVEGQAARAKQLIGIFNADDPQSLLLFLEKDPSLIVERHGERLVIRSPAPGN